MTGPILNATPVERAVCSEHTDRVAAGTCERCGRFVCSACQGEKGVCSSCQQLMASALPALAPRAKWASRFLGLHAITDAGWLLAHAWALAAAGGEFLETFEGLLGLVTFVAVIGSIIAFLRWLHLAVRQAAAMGVEVGETPGWAVGYWFIPIGNLYKPYRVVRSLVGGFGGGAAVRATHLSLWWGLWIAGGIFSQLETRLTMQDGWDAPESSGARMLGIIADAMLLAGAMLCIGIVRNVQNAFQRRASSI